MGDGANLKRGAVLMTSVDAIRQQDAAHEKQAGGPSDPLVQEFNKPIDAAGGPDRSGELS